MKDTGIQKVFLLLLFSWFLMHLPFLQADPDFNLSDSRDAFTDEGLNTSQIRNFVNHGTLDIWECDNLVKTPLFNTLLFLPLQWFGTYLPVARLVILSSVLLLLFFCLRSAYLSQTGAILLGNTLMQYYVFQYCHFSLSELLSCMFIFAGLVFLFTYLEKWPQRAMHLFWASLCIACAYYAKVQFLYVALIIPAILLGLQVFNTKNGMSTARSYKPFLIALAWMFVFFSLYCITWYYPNREIFNYVLLEEATAKYAAMQDVPKTIAFNVVYVLFNKQGWMFNIVSLICFITGIFLLRRTSDRQFALMFILASSWLIFESHKLSMIYLPARYLVSFYFASGLMSASVIGHLVFRKHDSRYLKFAGLCLLTAFVLKNAVDYGRLLFNRQYAIQSANEYLALHLSPDQKPLALGPWAPSLTWNCKSVSKPVWYQFMNDGNILAREPAIIVSEPGEADSNHAFSLNGIDLSEQADSTRTFAIGRWEVIIYWMRDVKMN